MMKWFNVTAIWIKQAFAAALIPSDSEQFDSRQFDSKKL
jgi:hypothetical protein